MSAPVFRRRTALLSSLGLVLVALPVLGAASACQSLAGGPVLSMAEYQERVADTEAAGERALGELHPAPRAGGGTLDEAGSSCKDEFGFDDGGVTRSEPQYEWSLEFADRDAYLTAVENLHRAWTERGLDVRRVETDEDTGLPGVTATDDGIELTLAPDWYAHEPVLRADAGCLRHEYDYRHQDEDGSPSY
ncbi:hypothetical protein [Streptomyces sp.]|uniref:hypothetical protein n=1 Tax=Streptomyces sp. TaxID=1931 RepID=UPI002D5FD51A|nr:hypothetical protein [Streptomyces sp.]HZF89358.1 hypothetical protein [Streptomyces sp.]